MAKANTKVRDVNDLSALLTAFGDAFNAHDIEAVLALMTDDVVYKSAIGHAVDGDTYQGKEAIKDFFTRLFADIPDAHWQTSKMIVQGETGATEWVFTGTNKYSGQKTAVQGCDIITFANGKVAVKNAFRKQRLA